MPPHPEIEHIVTVLEHVRDKRNLPTRTLKLTQKAHQEGADRLNKAHGKFEPYALAIWELGQQRGGGVPKYIKNYLEEPSVQRAFKILEHVGNLDKDFVKEMRKTPGDYGPELTD